MAATAFLCGDEDPSLNMFSDSLCHSQPCHYLKLSTVNDDGKLSVEQAIPWLTSSTASNADAGTMESRILFFNRYMHSDIQAGLPVSAIDLDRLICSYQLLTRFFMSEVYFRRVAGHYMTPVGPCWFLRDRHFAAVTLLRKEERVCQTIVILRHKFQTECLHLIIERCKRLQSFWQQPLLPMVVLLDFALEKHRQWSNSMLATCDRLYRTLELSENDAATHFSADRGPRTDSKDLSELLRNLTMRWHETIPSIGNLKSLIRSVEVMEDVAHSHGWHWRDTFQYFTTSAKDILEKFVEADARFDAYTRTIQIKVAQRDTQISQTLARSSAETAIATKRDSSSMKIIAVLTTLFLPSTFIATILSTPEYSNWPAGTTWRFWAISMPLTALVMVGLLVWLRYDTKHSHVPQHKGDDDIMLEPM